jgi:hypothetical protein
VFSFPDGAFNPVIADNNAIYLVGYSKIYQMLPRRASAAAASPHRATARAKRRAAARAHTHTKRTKSRK